MKKIKAPSKITFRVAVEATPDVSKGFKSGLTAIGSYKDKISVTNTKLLQGSLDIDTCTSRIYPNDHRWDYAFAYKGEVFFIEVHSANTGETSTVIKKLKWLKGWLHHKAPKINSLKAPSKKPFYWIQSKNFAILKTSPQYRATIKEGLLPISKLKLD